MPKQIGFHFGALAEPLEKQANEQGFTLGDKAEHYDKIIDGLLLAWFNDILTDSVYDKALQRLMKKLTKDVKPISDGGNENGDS